MTFNARLEMPFALYSGGETIVDRLKIFRIEIVKFGAGKLSAILF